MTTSRDDKTNAKIVIKLWRRFSEIYGDRLTQSPDGPPEHWYDAMMNINPKDIAEALRKIINFEAQDFAKWPPNCPEFVGLCRACQQERIQKEQYQRLHDARRLTNNKPEKTKEQLEEEAKNKQEVIDRGLKMLREAVPKLYTKVN